MRVGAYAGQLLNDRDYNFCKRVAPDLFAAGITDVSFNLKWYDVEKSRGVYTWGKYDERLRELHGLGFRPYVRISKTPTCWSANTDMPPADLSSVSAFIAAFAQRFEGICFGLLHVFNEPNAATYFTPRPGETRPQSLTYVTRAVFDGLLEASSTMYYATANPEGRYVTSASSDTWAIDDFVTAMVAAGYRGEADAIGIHNYPGYPSARPPEYVFEWAHGRTPQTVLDNVQTTLRLAGLPDQLAITEVGWLADGTTAYPMNDVRHADWNERNMIHAAARGVDLYHVMFLRDITVASGDSENNRKGLFRDDYSARPVVERIANLHKMLREPVRCLGRDDLGSPYLWSYRFLCGRKKSREVTVRWSQGGEIYRSGTTAKLALSGDVLGNQPQYVVT